MISVHKLRSIFEFRKYTKIYGMIGAVRNLHCQACDMTDTRSTVTGIEHGLVRECSETQSRSNEKIIYLLGYIPLSERADASKARVSRRYTFNEEKHRCTGNAFTNMHQRVRVAERLSHAKSLRDIEYFPRTCIYLSQCVRMQYPIAINAVVSNAQSLISQNIRNAL